MRHLAPEPIVDVGVARRWLGRLSPCISLDFFRHRVSSSDERRRLMTPGVRPEDHVSGGGRLPRMIEAPGEAAGDLSFERHGRAAARPPLKPKEAGCTRRRMPG